MDHTTTKQYPIQLRLYPSQMAALKVLAAREGVSVQELIRLAVREYLASQDRASGCVCFQSASGQSRAAFEPGTGSQPAPMDAAASFSEASRHD